MGNRDSSTNQIVKNGDRLQYTEAVRAFDLRFASTLTPAVRRSLLQRPRNKQPAMRQAVLDVQANIVFININGLHFSP
jgi:hypothetical protein